MCLSLKRSEIERFRQNIWPTGYVQSLLALFRKKNDFLPLLAAILNFCVKHKNVFISEMKRDRAISTNFLTHRVSTESQFFLMLKTQKRIYLGNGAKFLTCRVFSHSQKSFSRHFWRPSWISALNAAFISETVRDRAISTTFLSICGVYFFSQKNVFLPLLAAILNFCVKHKNVFISETKRDRAISTNFLTHRVSTESQFFLMLKTQKRIYLGNGAKFLTCRVFSHSQKSFSRHFWRPSWISALNAAFISETVRDRAISTTFLSICGVYFFSQKNVFLPLLAAILNFCVKHKNVFISEMKRDRAISTNFLTHRVSTESQFFLMLKTQKRIYLGNGAKFLTCRVFSHSQKSFSRHFWRPSWISALNAAFISETVRDRAISTTFLSICGVYFFSQKNVFLPLLAAILNFCVKHKNVFISETKRDRAISTNFLTHRVSAESTGDFSQKLFSCHFWRPSWISRWKAKKIKKINKQTRFIYETLHFVINGKTLNTGIW